MEILALFNRNYEKIRVEGFESKYLPYLDLKNYLDEYFSDKKLLGHSFLGNDIYGLKIGTGKIKVLAWSQMHGNESTGTRAMLDALNFLKLDENWVKELLESVTFHFIPMLNPDGASLYTRRNAGGVDLNRDFIQEASPEIKILKHYVEEVAPQYLFNLHDQRTIFNVGDTPNPATLAFLAPSVDVERSINEPRVQAMAIIDTIYKGMQEIIPGYISRFTDEFYPTSTGDNFMKMGVPTILFEAGHYPNDYERDHTRKYNALAILLALDKIAKNEKPEIGDYFGIPENKKKFLDIILRNVRVSSNESEMLLDIGIYFEERLDKKKHEVVYCARIEEIGDLSAYHGHLDINKNGKTYIGKATVYPKIGDLADFSVGTIHFEKGKFNG